MKIREYLSTDLEEYKSLIQELWNDVEDKELIEIVSDSLTTHNKVFVAEDNSTLIGFLNTSIRTDYVEGASTNKTGYIEGIFVVKEYRKKHVASNLLETAFEYFKSLSITEVGSDIELDNTVSKEFHEKVGFKEMSRNIHYLMRIK